jgi:quinol monooxygenase YgiN
VAFSLWVELQVQADKLETFLKAIAANQAATEAEPGCLFFDVVKLDREGHWFGFYEIYQDESSFYEDHRTYPHYLEWRKAVQETIVPGSQTLTPGTRTIGSRNLR